MKKKKMLSVKVSATGKKFFLTKLSVHAARNLGFYGQCIWSSVRSSAPITILCWYNNLQRIIKALSQCFTQLCLKGKKMLLPV